MKKICIILVCFFCCFLLSCSKENTEEITKNYVSLQNANIGDLVIFGKIEQDNDFSNSSEDIIWLVLNRDISSLFLVSKNSLEFMNHYENGSMQFDKSLYSWKNSKIRNWLNSTFYDNAFSTTEKQQIQQVTLGSQDKIKDKVFLLSAAEVSFYFNSTKERICEPSEYAKSKGAKTSYWTRENADSGSVGYLRYIFVENDGELNTWGFGGFDKLAVRPVIYVSI